ncbi:hypothetical protein H0H93_002015 [Arthromyces matolae]|nr:hypothetical protein H0H93_002015 [Arthromyces matolae]
MIFKTNLIQTVTIACILHVALAVPIPHDNSPKDQTITSFPSLNPSPDAASPAFNVSLNLMTRSESNLPGSLTLVNHEELSNGETFTPRNPVGDSSQSPRTANNRVPGQQVLRDPMEQMLKKNSSMISEHLRKEWNQHLEKREQLKKLSEKVLCARFTYERLKALDGVRRTLNNADITQARTWISAVGGSSDTRKAAQQYVDFVELAPSAEELVLCTNKYNSLTVEERVTADALLMEGWRLRQEMLLEMEASMAPIKYEVFSKVVNYEIGLARPYAPALGCPYSTDVQNVAGAFINALSSMAKRLEKKQPPVTITLDGDSPKRPGDSSLSADHGAKRQALEENPAQAMK